jgi:predicted O-methyltransferase YrrM
MCEDLGPLAKTLDMTDETRAENLSYPSPNKLATAAWFLRRPYTYRHLAELVRRSLMPSVRRLEDNASEAVAWGEATAISAQDALERLLGPGSYPAPGELHPDVFAEAKVREHETGMQAMSGPANLELLYHLTRKLPAKRAVETGVSSGWSSLAILLAQEDIGGGTLISTDMPYPRVGNENYVGSAVPDGLRNSWTLIRRPDRSALPRALAEIGEIDLAHYDSDKTYAGQSWAFRKIWEALRPSGVLIVDDIQLRTAFRDFASTLEVQPIVVRGIDKLIGVLQRPDGV